MLLLLVTLKLCTGCASINDLPKDKEGDYEERPFAPYHTWEKNPYKMTLGPFYGGF